MFITKDIRYIGVNDHKIDLFEGQYPVPKGMAYNSYFIDDEKIAVMDSVEIKFTEEWLGAIKNELGDRLPAYLIVQHMEPDHSANIVNFMNLYPNATIVASDRAFKMLKNFYGEDFAERRIVISDGGSLVLGKHVLNFIAAPMVHWPEVMLTYDSTDKVLFSADAFGKFGALDAEEEWDDEARRYYIGIVGKYGVQVQGVLEKAKALDIKTICPLHGPVLADNLQHYLDLYNTWSSYSTEKDGVMIAYTSVYGNTKKAALMLAKKIMAKGCENVAVYDLARCDMFKAVADAFSYGKIVLATTTYNSDIFPFMRQFIDHLTERGFKNKIVGMVENGSWAPQPIRIMTKMLETSQGIVFTENNVKITSGISDENLAQIEALAEELVSKKPQGEELEETVNAQGKKVYVCKICGYVYEGDSLPEGFTCPWCKHPASDFEMVIK